LVDYRRSWTFPFPGTDSFALFAADWEGLLLLNSTAGWIWANCDLPNLPEAYADQFGICLDQAREDIELSFDAWSQWRRPDIPAAVPAIPANFQYSTANFAVSDVVFCIGFGSHAIEAELNPRLAPIALSEKPPGPNAPRHIFQLFEHSDGTAVFHNGVHLATELLVTGARAILLQELTRLAVPGRDFSAILHAGAVGNQHACVILAGASFSGKSTLCATLMQSGLLCYSDDSACLTTDFQIAGMPFAISIREGSWQLFPQFDKPRFIPSNLNGTSPTAPPIALVFVEYCSDAEITTFEPVPVFDALVALQESGCWIKHEPAAITAFLAWFSQLPIHRLRYSRLDEAMAKVHELLDASEHMLN
jgi:hypothetical protein